MKQLLMQAARALAGLLPQTFTGSPSRDELVAHWTHERELGHGRAQDVLDAYAALDALQSAIEQPARTFSDFIRNATPEEKAEIYGRVMEASSQQQRAVVDAAIQQQEAPRDAVAWDGSCVLGHCGSPSGCEGDDRCRADAATLSAAPPSQRMATVTPDPDPARAARGYDQFTFPAAVAPPPIEGKEAPDEDEQWTIDRAADLLEHYAAYLREVKPDDLERHPYLPEIDYVAQQLRQWFAASPSPLEQPSEPTRCSNCGKPDALITDGDPEGEVYCSPECKDQHDELGCPHEHHNGYRHPVEGARLIACENALRSLASWLGAGGYNAPEVDAKVFEEKIRWGVENLLGEQPRGPGTDLTEMEKKI